MAIAGLVPLSTVDWPGKLAAAVFLQGCPLACPYCQNEAILDPKVPGAVPWSQVEALLARRAGLLDGVVLTGGEALRQAGVVDAARRVREMGFGVGLHTAGAYPRALAKTLPHTDWVGIDVKAMPDDYAAATGFGAGAKAWQSLDAVLEASAERARPALAAEAADADRLDQRAGADYMVEPADVGPLDYEVRTTVYPGAPATERFEELLGELRARGVRNFALQEARTDGTPVAFRAQALAWDRRAWAKRLAEMVDAASRAGFESFEARLA
ncbi:MAG: anaerobic ribonucleoside-triphosphate reductase activating protein [Peptidiphaga gingivicola]